MAAEQRFFDNLLYALQHFGHANKDFNHYYKINGLKQINGLTHSSA